MDICMCHDSTNCVKRMYAVLLTVTAKKSAVESTTFPKRVFAERAIQKRRIYREPTGTTVSGTAYCTFGWWALECRAR